MFQPMALSTSPAPHHPQLFIWWCSNPWPYQPALHPTTFSCSDGSVPTHGPINQPCTPPPSAVQMVVFQPMALSTSPAPHHPQLFRWWCSNPWPYQPALHPTTFSCSDGSVPTHGPINQPCTPPPSAVQMVVFQPMALSTSPHPTTLSCSDGGVPTHGPINPPCTPPPSAVQMVVFQPMALSTHPAPHHPQLFRWWCSNPWPYQPALHPTTLSCSDGSVPTHGPINQPCTPPPSAVHMVVLQPMALSTSPAPHHLQLFRW